ncbi:DsrE family protein [Halomonas sp. 328]|uniref:DsrE family protein n=1 Tax=Halomonas sp. 328 TaxID=2776704 RepID=UPI0018A74F61|nr:DsrE family protein [Halomonas sp. 328]MBF8221581.1 DsrE family protein [Halomonas sp. 328]
MSHESTLPEGDLLVVLRHGPHGSLWLREGLEAALVAAALGQRVSLLFMGPGVAALAANQQRGPLEQKGTLPMLEMLPLYEVESLLAVDEDLDALGLAPERLAVPAERIAPTAVAALMARHPLVLNF